MVKNSGKSDIEIDIRVSYVSAPAVKFQNLLIEVSLNSHVRSDRYVRFVGSIT